MHRRAARTPASGPELTRRTPASRPGSRVRPGRCAVQRVRLAARARSALLPRVRGARRRSAARSSQRCCERVHDAAARHDAARARARRRAAPRPRRRRGLPLPTARVSAVLVLMFLGFGVLIGDVAARHVDTRARAVAAAEGDAARGRRRRRRPPRRRLDSNERANRRSREAEPTPPRPPRRRRQPRRPQPPQPSRRHGDARSRSSEKPAPKPSHRNSRAIKHVFVLMLSDEPYAAVFGPESTAPLSRPDARAQGLAARPLRRGRARGAGERDRAAERAGADARKPPPTAPSTADIAPTGSGADEQVLGNGCVYPAATQTLPGQLSAKHLQLARVRRRASTKRATRAAPARTRQLGAADPTAEQAASSGAYATFRNPFVYFQSLTGSPSCAADDVGLNAADDRPRRPPRTRRASPTSSPTAATTATRRRARPGRPAGLAPADGFLEEGRPGDHSPRRPTRKTACS